jgi:nicotinate-nucleotide adenylyltransferase
MIAFRNLARLMACNSRAIPVVRRVFLWSLEGLLVDWHRPEEFVAACDLIGVMRRPGDHLDLTPLEETFPGIDTKLRFVEAPLLEISSRQIRSRICEGRPYQFYLPESVRQVIKERGIYANIGQERD